MTSPLTCDTFISRGNKMETTNNNSKEIGYHYRMATVCSKYANSEHSPKMRTYYLNKGKQHLEAIREIGFANIGIEL